MWFIGNHRVGLTKTEMKKSGKLSEAKLLGSTVKTRESIFWLKEPDYFAAMDVGSIEIDEPGGLLQTSLVCVTDSNKTIKL